MSSSNPGPSRAPADTGSRTQTITPTPSQPGSNPGDERDPRIGVLKLRGGPVRRQKVAWKEGTVDNEGMGKKKSKSAFSSVPCRWSLADEVLVTVCCIYHRPKAYDESSSESSSGSADDGEVGVVGSTRRKAQGEGGEAFEQSSESEGGTGDMKAK
jgi:protein phosphatase 1 regulatory subunit 11